MPLRVGIKTYLRVINRVLIKTLKVYFFLNGIEFFINHYCDQIKKIPSFGHSGLVSLLVYNQVGCPTPGNRNTSTQYKEDVDTIDN